MNTPLGFTERRHAWAILDHKNQIMKTSKGRAFLYYTKAEAVSDLSYWSDHCREPKVVKVRSIHEVIA